MERIRGLCPPKVCPPLAYVRLYLNLSNLRTTKKPPPYNRGFKAFIICEERVTQSILNIINKFT